VGAIINTRAEQLNAIRLLTLAGDTFVTSDFRWDVRGLGGNNSLSGIFDLGGFTFTRAGTNRIAVVDAVATNAGNIVMLEGGMSLTRSIIGGPGYIDVGTNFVWIENSTTGMITKPMIFSNGRLQCSGADFLLHSFITNASGLTIDTSGLLIITNAISGAGALTKIGPATVRLEAANTYAGNTTISNGILALGANGTLGGGSLLTLLPGATLDVLAKGGYTIASGKTLEGGGTVQGDLVVAGGGTLQVAGPLTTGTLTVNGSVTLGGHTAMEINGFTKARDLLTATNAIAYGGTLTVQNLGGNFVAGDTFQLFIAPVTSGAFSTVNLPPLGPSQIWVNRLGVNGTIAVGELVLNMAQIPGGFLQFTWDSMLNGLVKLQSQTNSLNVGISNNWVDVPGGTFNGTVHVPDPNNPTVFFRLSTTP
jgi:autotransporter-associated beta strand protein